MGNQTMLIIGLSILAAAAFLAGAGIAGMGIGPFRSSAQICLSQVCTAKKKGVFDQKAGKLENVTTTDCECRKVSGE